MEQNVLNTDLTGKVAVVTGASGTLCSIFAKALARAGAKVALLGRNMEKLKALADEIEAEGGIARGYTCNVMNKANCLQVAEDVMAELGSCDILVNGAGGNNARANTDKEYFEMADLEDDTVTFFDLDESGVEMVFDLNFIGTLLPTQAFARQMVGRPGCNILNISSMNAYLPLTKIPAYSGSKAAVTNFTQWLAVHFSKVGIRVNAIAPGFFASEQNASLLYNEGGTPTARTNKILAATPMGRFGDSEKDLVGALLFLLNNDAAGFITGILHTVLGIPGILASILTQISLYSINLNIMGCSNQAVSVDKYPLVVSLRYLSDSNSTRVQIFATCILFCFAIVAILYWYFGTEQGHAIRATGCNQQMARAQGINTNLHTVIALMISNGLVGLSGGLYAQYQGAADVNMGRGAIVIGLAAVIIGEVLFGRLCAGKNLAFAYTLFSVIGGAIIYYIVMNVVLWLKLPSDDLKLFSAIVVAVFLAIPYLKSTRKGKER